MASENYKRVLEILREDGPLEVAKRSFRELERCISRKKRMKLYTHINNKRNELLYDAPPSPYQTIEIRAREVQYLITDKSKAPILKPHNSGFAQIKGGDWPHENYFMKYDTYYIKTSFEKRFLNNQAWEVTSYYRYLTEDKGYSREKAINKLHSLDSLYESILEKGYQPNYSKPNHKGTYEYREELEPFVVIDDVGELYTWDGLHRFCVASILDLKIPVHIVCRHEQWQELRDDIYNNGLSEEHGRLRDHPDLQDVLN